MRRLSLAIGLAGICLLGAAQPAAAVDVSPSGYWDVIDRAGVANNVEISQVAPGRIRVSDIAGVTFPGGSGSKCVAESPQAAVCEIVLPLTGESFFNMGAGDDTLKIVSFPFLSRADGGEGNDTISAPLPEAVPSLPGSPGNTSKLIGGPGNDLLIGNAADDELNGEEGDDTCLGGLGADTCNMGPGDDRCQLDEGNDSCFAKGGRDSCDGGAGKDRCNTGGGRDQCAGGPGRDKSNRCERRSGFEIVFPKD